MIGNIDGEDNFKRWHNWLMLEHGELANTDNVRQLYENMRFRHIDFSKKRFYWGAGMDAGAAQYADWDLCDLRQVNNSLVWDVLMGFPYDDGELLEVKNKLSLGMMTYDQARFTMRESARTLKIGGKLTCTFRDRGFLEARDIDGRLFNRYVYGSGLYYGSRRKSCWKPEWVRQIAAEFKLNIVFHKTEDEVGPILNQAKRRGMNSTMEFMRVEGNLKKFSPDPKVEFNPDGTIRNLADDFHFAEVAEQQ